MNEVLIGIACEDNGHFRAVSCLIDQRCLAAHDWLDGVLDDCRRWIGVDSREQYLKTASIDRKDVRPQRHKGLTIKQHGLIGGKPLENESSMWRKALSLFRDSNPRPEVVVLARDSDRYDRRAGIIQVRDGFHWPFRVVIAVAHPEVEAWYVSGFEPKSHAEKAHLEQLTRDLSFNPTIQSHRLTSQPKNSPRDAKRVLANLCGEDLDRQRACLTDEQRLRARGGENGLAQFLDEIDESIVPLFGRKPA